MNAWNFLFGTRRERRSDRKTRRAAPLGKTRFQTAGLETLEARTLLAADLAMTNQVAPTTALVAGDVVQYNLTVANSGASDATNTVVTDQLPTGETFLGLVTPNNPAVPNISYDAADNTVTYNVGTVTAGSTGGIGGAPNAVVFALVNSSTSGTLTDTAAVYSADDPSHSTSATAATSQQQNSVTALGAGANDLAISVSPANNNAPVTPGGSDNVVYTITVKNNGSTTASGVQVTDVLPNGSFPGTNSSEPTGVTVTFPQSYYAQATLPNLGAGQSLTFSITVDGPDTPPGALINVAAVSSTGGDTSSGDNFATTVTPVMAATGSAADLSISESASPTYPVVNQSLTYTLTVTNNSTTTDATNVYVTDLLPTGATFVSGTSSLGGVNVVAQSGSVVSALIPTLAKGTTATLTVTVTPTAAGVLANAAYVESTDNTDGTQPNNAITLDTNVTTTALTAHQKYVTAVYEDVLGRSPDAGGLSYWSNLLDQGAAIASVATAIAHSAEYYQNFVIAPDYVKLLGRVADAAGLAYWTSQMQAGLTDQGLEAGFVASNEFYLNAGGTNTAWIDSIYTLLLGRTVDASGETYWAGQLAAGDSRSDVALAIADSAENETKLLDADYQHYLGRAADAGGVTYWLAQFAAGQTNEDVIAGFTGSAEYYQEKTS